ncbi:MAG: PAS domain-containing protein [Candidatus Tectomicrobia bacterium]|nr:PAS domain-containing protein [Candidatus Tectomicrobia bacterium]
MHDADNTAAQFLTDLTALNQQHAALIAEVHANRQMEKIMGAQQHMLVCIAKAVPFLLYVYDLVDHCILYVNDRSVTMLGYTADEIHAQGSAFFRQVLHPADFSCLSGELPQRFATAQDGDVIETEYRIKHANGQWRWFCSRDVVLARSADGARQILGTAQDITKRKRIGHRVLKSGEEYFDEHHP